MTEDFLKVLIYLMKNHLLAELVQTDDMNNVLNELSQAGFAKKTSVKAVAWLHGIKDVANSLQYGKQLQHKESQRIFCAIEMAKISPEGRSFLMQLEQRNLIDAITRELIIDRVMALEAPVISLLEIRCIANMILLRDQVEDPNLLLLSEWLLNDQETIH